MNINSVADEVLAYLNTKHDRVYRNKAAQSPEFPYVVFKIDSALNNMPSEDLTLNIDIYEKSSESVRDIEDLADLIDGDGRTIDGNNNPIEPSGLNQKIINTTGLNMHFNRDTRQYVSPEELVSAHLVKSAIYNTDIFQIERNDDKWQPQKKFF